MNNMAVGVASVAAFNLRDAHFAFDISHIARLGLDNATVGVRSVVDATLHILAVGGKCGGKLRRGEGDRTITRINDLMARDRRQTERQGS